MAGKMPANVSRYEAPDAERQQRVRNGLDHAEDRRAGERGIERGTIAPLLAENPPNGRSNDAETPTTEKTMPVTKTMRSMLP